MYIMITIRQDLDVITSILCETFEIPSFKRNYDVAFGQIESEEFAITKFKEWIIEQIT